MTWAATQAKAKFSEVLDKAETEGPQIVRRRKREFVLLTREELTALNPMGNSRSRKQKTAPTTARRTMAEFFRNSPLRGLDIEFERIDLSPRHIEF